MRFRRRRRDPSGSMSVVEHLGELRNRLFVSALAVLVGAVVGWFLYDSVYDLLTDPFCAFMTKHPNLAVEPSDPCKLAYSSVTEPFLIKIKMATFIGFALALPVLLFHLWRFITPGLTSKERRFALPFVFASLVLFALGAWFAMLTLPRGLDFLLGFAGTARVVAVMSIGKYVGFVMFMILAFGLSFEFPVVLISLTRVGVLTSRQLRNWRRYAVVIIAALSAVLTPSQDWFTMTAMMVPLLVFYEASILISRLMKR